jgi:hypothetical protein
MGEFVEDTVMVAGINVKNQIFGLTYQEEGFAFMNVPFEGILGLSFPSISKTNSVPFFDNIISQQLLDYNIFSLFLSEREDDSNILFGSVEKDYMSSNFTFIDVVSETYWEIDIEDILINGKQTNICDDLRQSTDRCGVAIDSGTSLYAAPSDIIYDLLNDKLQIDTKCSNFQELPKIEILVKARESYLSNEKKIHKIVLLPEDYIINGKNINKTLSIRDEAFREFFSDEECLPAFMPINVPRPRGPILVFGEFFMRKFYTVFDRDQRVLGLSLANQEYYKKNKNIHVETPYDKVKVKKTENENNSEIGSILSENLKESDMDLHLDLGLA